MKYFCSNVFWAFSILLPLLTRLCRSSSTGLTEKVSVTKKIEQWISCYFFLNAKRIWKMCFNLCLPGQFLFNLQTTFTFSFRLKPTYPKNDSPVSLVKPFILHNLPFQIMTWNVSPLALLLTVELTQCRYLLAPHDKIQYTLHSTLSTHIVYHFTVLKFRYFWQLHSPIARDTFIASPPYPVSTIIIILLQDLESTLLLHYIRKHPHPRLLQMFIFCLEIFVIHSPACAVLALSQSLKALLLATFSQDSCWWFDSRLM